MLIVLIGYSKHGSKTYRLDNFKEILINELIEIKKILLKKFSPNHIVNLINHDGVSQCSLEEIEFLSNSWIKHRSSLYIPPLKKNQSHLMGSINKQ